MRRSVDVQPLEPIVSDNHVTISLKHILPCHEWNSTLLQPILPGSSN